MNRTQHVDHAGNQCGHIGKMGIKEKALVQTNLAWTHYVNRIYSSDYLVIVGRKKEVRAIFMPVSIVKEPWS